MASVPELAICYHENGVVQGYELLKTDDIFLLKGVSDDGTPAFHPYVVQQNGLSVLRFLQENCKQDPGAYWVRILQFSSCIPHINHKLILGGVLTSFIYSTSNFCSFIKVRVKMGFNFLIFL